jgi:uncharacterized protein
MKHLSILLKPASSLCNMRCGYCFYRDEAERRAIPSYGIMSEETVRGILCSVRQDLSPGDRLTVAFQGGEPTLAGIGFFEKFFAAADELMQGIQLGYSVQTNGLLLDDAFCCLFAGKKVLVGLSLDGPSGVQNRQRPDAAGKGSYGRIRKAMELLRFHRVEYNVLAVLTNESARHPISIWNWLLKEKIRYVQFIPCLDRLDAENPSPFALTPSRFRDFYRQIFPLWKRGMEEGQIVSIKLFDDLVNLYLSGRVTACGMTGNCTVQYVVEANGDVFPCDFYVLDRYKMGSLLTEPPSKLHSTAAAFLTDGRDYVKESPCRGCRYENSCFGGCKRQKNSMYLENGRCCYAELLDEILIPLLHFSQTWLSRQ